MTATEPGSAEARQALALLRSLQERFAEVLHELSARLGCDLELSPSGWLRDGGRHGGGQRLSSSGDGLFDRASLNVSAVHYDDEPEHRLGSATALSCIVHPRNPHAPSLHLHESFAEPREGPGAWRLMADLNPALEDAAQTQRFARTLRDVAPDLYEYARLQGDRYFRIDALGRHRGVCHFYLEGYTGEHFAAELVLARRLGEAVIDCYASLLDAALHSHAVFSEADRVRQLAYHTLYVFQVLTLDRGTTAGLLVHDENDLGILGSLPSHVDRALLASWGERLSEPQDALLRGILEVLPDASPCALDDATRLRLAGLLRAHYGTHPEALALQAAGGIPPARR